MIKSQFAVLMLAAASATWSQPTYSRDISRIVQAKCQICHRPGDIAPFALMNYADAQVQGRAIRTAVAGHVMPPWKPVPGHGSFKGDLSLSDDQVQTILDWVDAGMPEGDPADLPPAVVYTDEWRLGQPDQVISMLAPYFPIPREDSSDRYRCFVIPSAVDQDRWVKSVDIVPGLRQFVHHVILYMTDDPTQIALTKQLEDEDPDPGYDCWGGPRITPGVGSSLLKAAGGMLGGWVPGASPGVLPDTIGTFVPKGTYMIMQVHYNMHHGDPPAPDLTRVGLYFHTAPPKNRLFSLPLLNDKFELQPGVMGQQVDASFKLDFDSIGLPIPDSLAPKFSAVRVGPHMHTLGSTIRADVIQPDGTQVPLIEIDAWDFHYQGFYDYSDLVQLPYHSTIKASCTFDNTTDRVVRWGESTEDEMCLVFVGFIAEGGISFLLSNPSLLGRPL